MNLQMNLPEFLFRLLIAVLVYWLGEKIVGLVGNEKLKEILTVVLIIAVVLYVIFGSMFPIR